MNLSSKIKQIKKIYNVDVTATEDDRSVIVEGEANDWQTVVDVGKVFVNRKSGQHVVNNVKLKGFCEPEPFMPKLNDSALDGQHVDVLIVGGGIIGCAICRELAKYDLSVLLVEKHSDVAHGASGANDGMVHAGIDLHSGYKKTYFGPKGNSMFGKFCSELGVPFVRTGQYVVFDSAFVKLCATYLLLRAKKNKIPNVRMLSRKEMLDIEPTVSSYCKGALYLPSTGAVAPYKLCVGCLENAVQNGARYSFDTAVLSMETKDGKIASVKTNRGTVYPQLVVNAAGVFADKIAEMANDKYFSIHPRKGTDLILDKKEAKYGPTTSSSRSPNLKTLKLNKNTKGGGVIKTADGNVLLGPDAIETPLREDTSTTSQSVSSVFNKQSKNADGIYRRDVIAYFSGVRAANYEEDFIVETSSHVHNLIHAACIQSPGLTAAPAIAETVERLAVDALSATKAVEIKKDFNPVRVAPVDPTKMTDNQRDALIKSNPDYGKIVCRCEEVSLGEIKDAIHAIVPATTVDAVKRRTRAGMGRCQGGFCAPLIMRILSEELNVPLEQVKKCDGDSNYIFENIQDEYEKI